MIAMNEARITPYLGRVPVKLLDDSFGVLIQIRASDWTVGVQVPNEEDIRWIPLMTVFDLGNGALVEVDRQEMLAHWSKDSMWQEPYRTHAIIAALLGWYATAFHQWTDHDGYGRWTGPVETMPDPIHHTPFRPTIDLNDAWFALVRMRSDTSHDDARALLDDLALNAKAHPTPATAARAICQQMIAAVESQVHETVRGVVRSQLDALVITQSMAVRVPTRILLNANLTNEPLSLPPMPRDDTPTDDIYDGGWTHGW